MFLLVKLIKSVIFLDIIISSIIDLTLIHLNYLFFFIYTNHFILSNSFNQLSIINIFIFKKIFIQF